MSLRLFCKPLTCLCHVAAGQRPLLPFRRHLQSSAHQHGACGNRANGPIVQGTRRAQHYSNLEHREWRPQPAYLSTNKLAGGTLRLRCDNRHVCQATALLDTKPKPDKQNLAPSEHKEVHKQLTMDYTALVASTQELKTYWTPAKVAQCVQSDKQTLCLRLRALEGDTWLYLCWHPVSGRICTGPQPARGTAAEAFSFGEQIEATIRQLVLLDAVVPQPWERVVQLSFGVRPATPATHHIYLEVMGRYSNVILARPDGEILLCAYQVGSKMSSARQLQTGGHYQLPPKPQGISPDPAELLDSWQNNVSQAAKMVSEKTGKTVSVADGMVRAYQGVSPALSRELCALADVPLLQPASTSAPQWQALYQQWQSWLTRLQQGSFAAGVDGKTGRYSVLGSLPPVPSLQLYPGSTTAPAVASLHAVMHHYHTHSEGNEHFRQLQQQVSSGLKQGMKRLRNKMSSLQQQMGSTEESQQIQKQADLLTANIYRWQPGQQELQVEDWDTGTDVTIPLTTGKTAVETAEGLYKQARKRRRAGDQIIPLLEKVQADLAYLEEVEDSFQAVPHYEDGDDLITLKGIQEELVAEKYMRAPADASLADKGRAKGKKATKRAGATALQGFRKYSSPSDIPVLVGRNNKQNDELTNKVAKAGDVWMHARGCPGAHVLLRASTSNSAVQDADLQFAADLAAWYSKKKGEGKCPVIMASPTDIKKPKGAAPGQVMVKKETSILGKPDNSVPAQEERL